MKKSLASMCLSAVLTVAFSYHAVAADLPEIEKSGTLKVATEDDYAPFNFMNNGQADGFKESANKQVISSQADSLIKISRIWADFFPANT
ncbi:hypothetical protein ACH7EI_29415, partial [Klebsiella pneumoniae]